jgi:hypothetical protein
MQTRWSGANGRYQAACGQGHCALTGGQATSRQEGQIFALLNYALGPGQSDLQIAVGTRVLRLDMAFPLPIGCTVVVEYDGAYWHIDQEERDRRKTDMVEFSGPYLVIRIREDPLQPLSNRDVSVPARADPAVCAQLVLLHLIHIIPGWPDYDTFRRIGGFVKTGQRPLTHFDIRCEPCKQIGQQYAHFRWLCIDSQRA